MNVPEPLLGAHVAPGNEWDLGGRPVAIMRVCDARARAVNVVCAFVLCRAGCV